MCIPYTLQLIYYYVLLQHSRPDVNTLKIKLMEEFSPFPNTLPFHCCYSCPLASYQDLRPLSLSSDDTDHALGSSDISF